MQMSKPATKQAMPKLKFWCTTCKYKFSRAFKPNLCPYCGKSSVEEDFSRGAEDLIQEVSGMDLR